MAGMDALKELAHSRGSALGFEVKTDLNYGAGEVDVVWRHRYHPNLPVFQVGFITVPDAELLNPDDIPPFMGLPLICPLDKIILVAETQAGKDKLNGLLERFRAMEGPINLPAVVTVVSAHELGAEAGPTEAREAVAR